MQSAISVTSDTHSPQMTISFSTVQFGLPEEKMPVMRGQCQPGASEDVYSWPFHSSSRHRHNSLGVAKVILVGGLAMGSKFSLGICRNEQPVKLQVQL